MIPNAANDNESDEDIDGDKDDDGVLIAMIIAMMIGQMIADVPSNDARNDDSDAAHDADSDAQRKAAGTHGRRHVAASWRTPLDSGGDRHADLKPGTCTGSNMQHMFGDMRLRSLFGARTGGDTDTFWGRHQANKQASKHESGDMWHILLQAFQSVVAASVMHLLRYVLFVSDYILLIIDYWLSILNY